jgi:hypothetical protein
MNLNTYLQKRLTVSSKEAQLIEKVIKNYLKEVKTFKVTWDSETGENALEFSNALIESKTYDLQEDNSQRWKEMLDTAIADNDEIRFSELVLNSIKIILDKSTHLNAKMARFNYAVDHNFIFSESDDLVTILARMRQFFKYVVSKQKEYSFIDIYNLKNKKK